MSRYGVPSYDPTLTITVGRDGPLATFDGQVFHDALPDEDAEVLWIGTSPGEVTTTYGLQVAQGAYCTISEHVAQALERDYAARTPPTPLQQTVQDWFRRATGSVVLLLSLLGLPYAAGAERKAPPGHIPPAQAPTLSALVQVCQGFGRFAWGKAMDRDKGMPLTTGLKLSREWDEAHGASAEIRQYHEVIHRGVYTYFTVTPAQVRHLTESACLERLQPLEEE